MQNILSHLKNFNGETKDAFLRDSNGMMRGGDGPGTATSHCYREWGADKGIEMYASIAAKACWSPGIKPTPQNSSQPWHYCKEHIRALFPKNFFLDFFFLFYPPRPPPPQYHHCGTWPLVFPNAARSHICPWLLMAGAEDASQVGHPEPSSLRAP